MASKASWFALGGVAALCCFCGVGSLLLGGLGEAGKELTWLAEAGELIQVATVPKAEEMAVIRRIEGGEPLTPTNLTELEALARRMAERTRSARARLLARPTPPRLTPMRETLVQSADQLSARWLALAESVHRRDVGALRQTVASMRQLGDTTRERLEGQLRQLYRPGDRGEAATPKAPDTP